VDDIGDSVTEAADEGIDLVRSSISHALGANLENLTLTGAASSAGTGNGLGNVITGNNGHNTLDGGAGNDSLAGGGGTDLLIGGSGDDTLSGGAGVDTIDYSAAAGPVTVDLSLGAAVGDGADVLIGVEAVIGSAAADEITGNGAANLLSGLAGDDYLEGGSGSDTLMGGEGADILVGGSGVDQASYANAQGAVAASLATSSGTAGDAADDFIVGIENLLGGDFADTLEGNAAANLLEGGAGDDLLGGGAGADTLDGGAGVDTVTYAAAATTVTVQLTSSGGTATDQFGSTDTLISIDNVVGGSGDDVLLGNGNANQLEGGAGADNINGGAGDDLILGGAGVDVLVGTFGNDTLVGGADADVLNGGAGDDVFMFLEPGDLGTTRGTADRIVAFDGAGIAGGDLIDLSALDAIAGTPSDEAFVFQGSFTSNVAFTGAGYIRAVKTASATFIELNTTGGSAADLVIRVNGVYDFAASDFIL
jgi:Ca2+-binding RTX toxin-like protein